MLLLPLASFLSSVPSPLSLCSFGDGWSLIDFYLSFVVYLFIYLSCMLVCVGVRCLVACCVCCLYGCVLSLRVVCVACVRAFVVLLRALAVLILVVACVVCALDIFFVGRVGRCYGRACVRAGRRNYLLYATSL